MVKPRVLVLRAPGTNCDLETAYAFETAGAEAERVHVNRLLEDASLLRQYQLLCIPGGFSYGDDVAAGRILANQIQLHLKDAVHEFQQGQKLVLGICNGFQVLLKTGVLTGDGEVEATLTWNATGRYEDRWVQLVAQQSSCVLLRGIERMYLPIAHAEGRFVPRDESALHSLEQAGQLVLRYGAADGTTSAEELPFPQNPNGSVANVAGMCDPSGRILGMMPHPERHLQRTHHPRWTRGEGSPQGEGLLVFRNAVEYFC